MIKAKQKEITKELIDLYNKMKDNHVKRTGYILLPSFKGFDMFEISEERLRKYLDAERAYLAYEKSINDNKESS